MESSTSDALAALFSCGFGLFFVFFYCLMFFFIILSTIFWVWMLVDAVRREDNEFPSPSANQKFMWVLILIFSHSIGSIIYYFMVYKKMGASK